MFSRIAVVNRGEAAVRFIRAVRELNEEFGYGTKTIALHTKAERRAMFVREADEAVPLADTGAAPTPYLDHGELERALRARGADAAWVGWGFVAEDPAFAELCARLGVVFIGPPPEAMRRLGDKIEAKLLAEQSGVPVAPWSGGPVDTLEDAVRHAGTIRFPLILKARSGGGGRGIRVVTSEQQLEFAFDRTREEAQRAFGDPVVFMESLVVGGRHVEVQVIADNYGTVWAPGVRDCSVQRRNQKLIEESSSPALTVEQVRFLQTAAVNLVRAAGYRNAGTVEFLYQPKETAFAFLEVNTRLQVEHPVTEMTTGLDLVKLQLHVADGGRLEGDSPPALGHAIEARLNAEDPDRGFAPAPGTVQLLRLPSGPGVRVDTGIAAGDVIPPQFDSMVAKVIAWGRDRAEARARLRRALKETSVLIRGGTTNKAFLLDLLDRPEVISGEADTGWLDRENTVPAQAVAPHADVALLSAAIDVYDAEEALERTNFLVSAHGGRPRASHEVGRTVELRYQGATYPITVAQVGPNRYRVGVENSCVDVEVDRIDDFESHLTVGGRRFNVVAIADGPDHVVEVEGVSHRVTRDEAGLVRAPAPAVVVAVRAAAGDLVEAGATVAIVESMKMETAVTTPYAGRVREVLAAPGTQVDSGAPLLRVEPRSDDAAAPAEAATVRFEELAAEGTRDPRAAARDHLATLGSALMGYDVSAGQVGALVAEYAARAQVASDDPDLVHAELELLTTFADLCELSRNRPAAEEEAADERVHSPREHFHSYLHSLDVEREGLPDSFRQKLSRALARYGVTDLGPSAELEEAVYRTFLALQRASVQLPVVTALLEWWLDQADSLTAPAREELQEVLDRLIVASQVRYPVIGDLARSVRFRCVDQPLLEQAREQAYTEVREHLRYLEEHPDASDYADRIAAMVASPEPLIRLLTERVRGDGNRREPMLEVLTRRYYKLRDLKNVRSSHVKERQFVTADYELDQEPLHLITTLADIAELPELAAGIAEVAEDAGAEARLIIDVYLTWPDSPGDAGAMAEALRDVVARWGLPRTVRRVTLSVSSRGADELHHFTFRPRDDGHMEDRVIRDLHPMMAHRLEFRRLANFDVTRLPSDEDVYLFRCVARENPSDERLVALAEIRDITPLRDASGRVVAFPAGERILARCLDGIRSARAQQPPKRRNDANLMVLSVRQTVEFPVDELTQATRRLAPMTVGAGLEEVVILAETSAEPGSAPSEVALHFSYQPGAGVIMAVSDPSMEPIPLVDEYTQKVRRARARNTVYPYELIPLLTGPDGTFVEYDLDQQDRLVPVERPYGRNPTGIVVGVVRTPTARYPEGMVRVALFGDPTKALGSVGVPECARIVAAIDLAEEMAVPVEWFALSSGARISMDSGTENMDGVARGLRRLITFTQAGGEVNVVVAGINVGAQPYWNAEATMLMHTKGILVMTPESAMVLTGKQSLDYSGGVSAEDNFGIGGYDRVMGPNGQAQYWAPDLSAAIAMLFTHYEHAYVAPGERFPRRAATSDPADRDVRDYPHTHPDSDFRTVGDIFSDQTNPERKKPFDIRTLMRATVDQDHPTLERWAGMANAETSVVFDAHLGGHPVTLLGIESRPIPRRGRLPADGPDQWTAGTLFPRSSKKTARAINAASGNRPLVVLANLSGFDGSPESLRKLQLEYGAEIGRAIVNFDGPVVFCVVSRYHGGAFVVFSGALHDNLEVIAVEGSYASVIGGAPAAAVVFAGEVRARTNADPRVREMEEELAAADPVEQAHLRVKLAELREAVRVEKLAEVAAEFDQVHNIIRAQQVGSVHTIIPAEQLRPYLITAVEKGMERAKSAKAAAPADASAR
jgi:acetyl/propionyl-CoA carboxylase alpha subunit/acetyl-CoA carboxylase carboxyltransferase component